MGLDEVLNRTPEIRAWMVFANTKLLNTYFDMDDKEVREVMKGERKLPDTERPIQDYLLLVGESLRRTEWADKK